MLRLFHVLAWVLVLGEDLKKMSAWKIKLFSSSVYLYIYLLKY